MKIRATIMGIALSSLFSISAGALDNPASFHDFTVTSIDRLDLPLESYKGKAVLVVNTASFCGFTPQFKALQALWKEYEDQGLVVLGIPSNDFGSQEPGDEEAIKKFCSVNYKVDFPMTKKMVVDGRPGTAPLYNWMAAALGDGSRPQWNFHKYLIDKSGEAVAYFPSKIEPDAPELKAAINKLLTPENGR